MHLLDICSARATKALRFPEFFGETGMACGIDQLAEMAPRQEWFHKLLAPAIVLLFFLYIALLFARL
jgi:hypothetical protein